VWCIGMNRRRTAFLLLSARLLAVAQGGPPVQTAGWVDSVVNQWFPGFG